MAALAALETYDDLIAEVRDQLDDDGFEEVKIARAIRKAEAYFRRELPLAELSATATITVFADPPSDHGTITLEVGDADTALPYPVLTPLGSDNETNWLMERHPDIYVAGTLYYCHLRSGAVERAAEQFQALQAFIPSARRSEILSRWGRGPLIPRGITQVGSARA